MVSVMSKDDGKLNHNIFLPTFHGVASSVRWDVQDSFQEILDGEANDPEH